MSRLSYPLLCLMALALLPAFAGAQSAKITGVVLDVKCRPSGTAAWTKARLGMALSAGAQVRTGKRSQCQIKFPDGSIVRLSPLSDMTIARVAGKDLSMGHGKLWARIVKGTTARIQGGTGVASIKGTVLEFDAGDIKTPQERRENVLRIFDGLAELTGPGGTQLVGAGTESRIGGGGTPTGLRGVPTGGFSGMGGGEWWDGVGDGKNIQSTPASYSGIVQRQETTDSGRPPWMGAPGQVPQEKGSVIIDIESVKPLQAGPRSLHGQRMVSLPMPPAEAMLEIPPMTLAQTPSTFFGKRFFGPQVMADLFGLVGTDKSLAGLRVHPAVVWGDLYFEVGGTTWVTSEEDWRTELTEAFVRARPSWGDLTVGRQHILAGPVNNSNLGTLLSFYTADAVRWQPSVGDMRLDLAYIHDFLPLDDETEHGYYGRLEANVLKGTAGVNVVHREDVGTGWSADLSTPLIEGVWDVYGEIGQDAADNDIYTIGSYFPDLYQKEDIDLFIEYAHRTGLPSQCSLYAYREFEDLWTAYLAVHATDESDVNVSLGAIKRFE